MRSIIQTSSPKSSVFLEKFFLPTNPPQRILSALIAVGLFSSVSSYHLVASVEEKIESCHLDYNIRDCFYPNLKAPGLISGYSTLNVAYYFRGNRLASTAKLKSFNAFLTEIYVKRTKIVEAFYPVNEIWTHITSSQKLEILPLNYNGSLGWVKCWSSTR